MEIKIGGKTRFENFTKTIVPFALVGYEVIITNPNSRYALVGYFITSYATRAHGIIVIYFYFEEYYREIPETWGNQRPIVS